MNSSKLNFYDYNSCQEILDNSIFWLVEAGDNTPVFVSEIGESNNSTRVINRCKKILLVLPIDHNVPIKKKNNPYQDESLCDALIQTESDDSAIIFVELKNTRKSKIQKAKSQLASTLNIYQAVHPDMLNAFESRYAYITHRLPNRIHESHVNIIHEFKEKYDCILKIEKQITI